MANRGKPSVFAAFNQMHISEKSDSEDGSAENKQRERKEKQKQRKKSRSKKKSSDSVQLKDLAFVSAPKPRKSKSKSKKCKTGANTQVHSPSGSSVEEAPASSCISDEREEGGARDITLADIASSIPHRTHQPQQMKVMSPSRKQKQQNEDLSSVQPAFPSAPNGPQFAAQTEMGAVYTPSHITITRVDGQMKRTVSVTEVMDQLLRYTQQNTQLLIMQEQLGLANRNLQDQLQHSADINSGLQNEVTMFRQMCLNLQAEVSRLRSNLAMPIVSDAGSNPQLQHHHRPPPGMS